MKRVLVALVMILVASCVTAAEPSKTVRILFKDYGITNEGEGIGALSLGLCTWTDKENDFALAGYGDFKFIMLWDEKVNVGIGFAAKSPPDDAHYRMDLRMEASLTTHLFDCLELGAWYAPFWGLADKDDPWGFMAGYYFKF